MTDKGRRAIKIIIIVFISLIIGGFVLNWLLTYRLQSKLNKVLSEEVSKATDGFYGFSFEDLKVGLFSGELTIKGITFAPDSTAFDQWQRGDSLPDVYYDIHVGEIHFRGINLTWLLSYRKLDFSLFEIKSPDIKIYNPQNTENQEKKTENKELGTLYEILSPYIDVLTVGRINLLNMNVSYTVEDNVSPVVYALTDANFRAYGFRLDENSSESGKLLYCDDFEFIAGNAQELLSSDQIVLKTANIKLSTIESLIRIEGVHISPKESYWDKRMDIGGGFLNADIQSVDVDGVKFDRKNGENYLTADSFKISSTDIKYLTVSNEVSALKKDTTKQQPIDSILNRTWSMYNVISPILNSISIDKIGIEETKFSYTITKDEYTDVYTLDQFDFHANKFLIDSLSEKHKKFWYVDDFTMTGADINGTIASNNVDINVSKLRLSTTDKQFSISDVIIRPLSRSFTKDYISGDIDSISIDGLDYNTGISAERLRIESPNVEYFKAAEKDNKPSSKGKPVTEQNIFDFLNPYADFLSVKRIDLVNANIGIHNRKDQSVFRMKRLNFYATDFLVDENTRLNSRFLFAFDDIGLSFKDFDNILPGGDYRLQIKDANVSSLAGKVIFKDMKLIPHHDESDRSYGTSYAFQSPLFEVSGIDYDKYLKDKGLNIKSILLNAPKLSVIKTSSAMKPADKGSDGSQDLDQILKYLKVGMIEIRDADLSYQDRTTNDSLKLAFQSFHMNSLQWDISQSFRLGEVVLQSPQVDYQSSANATSVSQQGNPTSISKSLAKFASAFNINKFAISDADIRLKQTDMSVNTSISNVSFTGLDWNLHNYKSNLKLTSINIDNPSVKLDSKSHKKEEVSKKDSSDFYTKLRPYVNTLSIGNFGITKANVEYDYLLDSKKQERQDINTTNLAIEGITINTDDKKVDMADFRFNTKDLHFPIMDGFYTMAIDNIDINKKNGKLSLSGLHMIPAYPKTEFAYIHPKHKDWFDVKAGDITLSGIDFPRYLSDNVLEAKKLKISDVLLQNFKNQQIEIQHNIMPLIYEKIQDIPIPFRVDSTDVTNFSVMYEELPKKGTIPGKIYFNGMNGRIPNLTNIASYPDQYMVLDANGLFMGKGYFTASWHIPISPDYDCFILEANMKDFDLKGLNQIFTPLANAAVKSGSLNGFIFRTEASSKEANAEMLFLYNDLNVNVLKGEDGEKRNSFLSNVANAVIRSNNPNRKKDNPRVANIHIERDPYHSNFNYFWQILQPALVESAGVSQGTQNFVKKVGSFFTKVKNFFTGKKDNKKNDEPENSNK